MTMADNGHPDDRLVTLEEAAKICGKSVRSIRRWAKSGKLAVSHESTKYGKRTMIYASAITAVSSDMSLENDRGDGQGRTLTQDNRAGGVQARDINEAHYRIGWLESRVDMLTKALTEGAGMSRLREEALEEARQRSEQKTEETAKLALALARAERELETARIETAKLAEEKTAIEQEKERLKVQLREEEQKPWWKRLWRSKGAKEEVLR